MLHTLAVHRRVDPLPPTRSNLLSRNQRESRAAAAQGASPKATVQGLWREGERECVGEQAHSIQRMRDHTTTQAAKLDDKSGNTHVIVRS